jgi:hypothetical protein
MHPLCVVRHRVAISKLIDATTPGESRSNLAPPSKLPSNWLHHLHPSGPYCIEQPAENFSLVRTSWTTPTCFAEVGASNINSIQGRSYSSLELSVSSADASTQSSVFWSYSPSTGIPSATPRVISLFIWLPYVWTYLSTSDTEGYLRLRSRANPMHTSEEVSSFTIIENAMLESNKSSIQHYYNRTKLCCFAFIYWSKFIPTF